MSLSPPERPRIVLVAPNVSRLMGGEAIKSLHIFQGYRDLGFDVRQVAHARVRAELSRDMPELPVDYVEDGPVQIWLHRLGLSWLLGFVGSWLLTRRARQLVDETAPWLVHFTAPISPSYPFLPVKGVPVVIGPLNGNLLHPPAFHDRESRAKRIGALLLRPAQLANQYLLGGKRGATLFISGGQRTVAALELGGCRRDQMVFTLDSGVHDDLRHAPRLTHAGVNHHFLFVGRLVRYKGCDLAIKALKFAPDAILDIAGDGEQRAALEALAVAEGVADRVNFLGYIPSGPALFDLWRRARGFVFPSLAEANGIVIQEAMMIGLPVVAVNWGGPVELLDAQTGILIEPDDEHSVVQGLAAALRTLAADPALAERLSVAARLEAEHRGFAWSTLLQNWAGLYDEVLARAGSERRFQPWLAAHAPPNEAPAAPAAG
ncbi:MAG TPA: glycosyltransferase family 4 protein [Sphingobium sp.]|nr:glycosyltransferase family 4 protein [Sphingobium sp.]